MNKRKQIVKHKQQLHTVVTLRMIKTLYICNFTHTLSGCHTSKKKVFVLSMETDIFPPVCFMYCHCLDIIFITLLDLASYLKHCMLRAMNALNECRKISIYTSHAVIEHNIRQQQSVANLSTRPKPRRASMCRSKHLTKLCSALVQTLSDLQFNAVRKSQLYVIHKRYCKVCRSGGRSSPRTSAFVFIYHVCSS